ncbi:MAG TPA: hypothetical protein VFH73_00635 [Polyangia bacterium]|nr:hypothetical protein [Polyangia bacterium]
MAGKYTDDEVTKAKDIAEETPGIDAQEALEKAREELEEEKRKQALREAARRAGIKAKKSQYSKREVNPFAVLHMDDPVEMNGLAGSVASDSQLFELNKAGLDIPIGCTSSQAEKLMRMVRHRRAAGLCSYKQARLLGKKGFDTTKMRRETAGALIQAFIDHAWHPPQQLLGEIMSRTRQPGEEG